MNDALVNGLVNGVHVSSCVAIAIFGLAALGTAVFALDSDKRALSFVFIAGLSLLTMASAFVAGASYYIGVALGIFGGGV